jgi:hypothetical protein
LRLALKAQSQCRATLETLAAIKNPQPVAFVRQANIAHGPQQVNNAHASDVENQRAPNELLKGVPGVTHAPGERLDLGATPAASAANSRVEAVDAFERPENNDRQGEGVL